MTLLGRCVPARVVFFYFIREPAPSRASRTPIRGARTDDAATIFTVISGHLPVRASLSKIA
jgi:hypothetical protein